MKANHASKQARKMLIKQSKRAKAIQRQRLLDTGEVVSINQILLEQHYQSTGAKVLLRFDDWKREGFQVKRNSRSVRIWAKPCNGKSAQGDGTTSEYAFYPMCCLFSEEQVIPVSDEVSLAHIIRTQGVDAAASSQSA